MLLVPCKDHVGGAKFLSPLRPNVIASKAHSPEIGQVIDHALEEIGKENPRLKKVMPNNYSRPEIDKIRLGEVVEIFDNMDMHAQGEGLDLFGRLLQVACWYGDETPGYLLNFSHQQFFFELKDQRRQLQYRWIAERINGRILLYGTNASIGAQTSAACYQEYRNELMHANSINFKTREI